MAVIVYDITQRQSFLNLNRWVVDVKNERGSDVLIIIAANKSDLENSRVVSAEESEAKATELGLKVFEVSAKSGANIKSLFRNISQELPGMENVSLSNNAEFAGEPFKLQAAPQNTTKKNQNCKC